MDERTHPCSGCPVINNCPCDHHLSKCNWMAIFKETGVWKEAEADKVLKPLEPKT